MGRRVEPQAEEDKGSSVEVRASAAADSRRIDELGSEGSMSGFFSSFEGEGTGVFSQKKGVSGGRELQSAAEIYFKSLKKKYIGV